MPAFELRWGDEELKVADAISIQTAVKLIVASGYLDDIQVYFADGTHYVTHKREQEEQKGEFTLADAMGMRKNGIYTQ